MATYKWSNLADGSTINFNQNVDVLEIDVNVMAAKAELFRAGGVTLKISGKSVTLAGVIPENLTTTNVDFTATGSQLIIGDNNVGVVGDPLANAINGTTQDDQLHGLDGADQFNGLAGDDLIFGGKGDDTIAGSAGNDTVLAEENADLVDYRGQTGLILVRGGAGNDSIWGGTSADKLYGELDSDTIRGGFGSDTIEGGPNDDLIYGNQENDKITVSGTDPVGQDTVYGGQGNDTIDYANVLNSANDSQLVYGNLGQDTILGGVGADTVYGGQENDTIRGGGGQDRLFGNLGEDLIYGNAANDILMGVGGNDTLYGGKQNDILEGGLGVDLLWGGTEPSPQANVNADVFVFSPGDSGATESAADVISDFLRIEDSLDLPTSGAAGNYVEQDLAGGYAQAIAQAQILMNQNAATLYVFIAGDTDGYLFARFGGGLIDFSVILRKADLVTEFDFTDII
jgi:Ca2+-binding RTX toxin-like protein